MSDAQKALNTRNTPSKRATQPLRATPNPIESAQLDLRIERVSPCLPPQETEKHLSDLVTAKKVSAKIDRPGGVVDFKVLAHGADWLLNSWVQNIDKLLSTLDKVGQCRLRPVSASTE